MTRSINEVDLSKMPMFLSNVFFDREADGNENAIIPFGKKSRPAKRGCDEPGETTPTPRLEADPGDLHAARCPHGRPDPRPTAPLPMARPNPR